MNSDFLQMPTTRKQKKAKKSRGLEILSDIENLDVMLGENHFNGMDREESLDSNLARKPESATSNNFGKGDENLYLNRRDISSGIMPITARIQSMLILMLRLIVCRVN